MQRRMRLNFGFNLYNMPQIPGLPGVRTMVHGGTLLNLNLFKPELLKYGVITDTGTIIYTDDRGYRYHDFVACNPGDAISFNYFESMIQGTRATFDLFFFNSAKVFLSKISKSNDSVAFIAPANAGYFMFRTDVLYYTPDPSLEYSFNVNNLKVYINKALPPLKDRAFVSSYYSNVVFVYDYYNAGISHSDVIDLALAAANALPNSTLVFDTIAWITDRAILLNSNTTVVILNCKIKQTNLVFDNVFRANNFTINAGDLYGYPTSITTCQNISIVGYGNAVVSQCDVAKTGHHTVKNVDEAMVGDNWGWRTIPIYFTEVNNVSVKNIALTKTKCWGITFEMCNTILVSNICIYSNVKNGDGIDFRFGCKNISVSNIFANTSDDCVALNSACLSTMPSYPFGNYLYPMEATMKKYYNTPDRTILDIENISVYNVLSRSNFHVLIFLQTNSCKIKNASISKLRSYLSALTDNSIMVYANGNADCVSDISMDNVVSYNAKTLSVNTKIKNVTLNRFSNLKAGGVNLYVSDNAFLTGITVTNSTTV